MECFSKDDVLEYVRLHRLAVIATIGSRGEPQAALVGIAATDGLEIVFDTLSTTRKHRNLERNNRIAVTFSGPGERTLQLEGLAFLLPMSDPESTAYLDAYYAMWTEGPSRAHWPNLAYWRIAPYWARYSDYDRGPLIAEFDWKP